MYRYVLLAFFFLPVKGISQQYLDATKAEVSTSLKKNKSAFNVTDSTIVEQFSIDGHQFTRTYLFDGKKRCYAEKTKGSCDSCITVPLQKILADPSFGWKKINENQYVSTFEMKLMLEVTAGENQFSFVVLRTDWSAEMYRMLMN